MSQVRKEGGVQKQPQGPTPRLCGSGPGLLLPGATRSLLAGPGLTKDSWPYQGLQAVPSRAGHGPPQNHRGWVDNPRAARGEGPARPPTAPAEKPHLPACGMGTATPLARKNFSRAKPTPWGGWHHGLGTQDGVACGSWSLGSFCPLPPPWTLCRVQRGKPGLWERWAAIAPRTEGQGPQLTLGRALSPHR